MSSKQQLIERLKTFDGLQKVTDRITGMVIDLNTYINNFSPTRSADSLLDVYCQVSELDPIYR